MEHDNSSPPPLNKKYPQRKTKSTDFLIDNHTSNANIRAVVKPPKIFEVVCVNDESLSVMTRDMNANNITTISQTSNVVREKKKRRNVLTNKSSKFPKTIKANDKTEERECPKCNIVKLLMNIYQICFCERGYKNNDNSENSKKLVTTNVCNYDDCKWSSLVTEQ